MLLLWVTGASPSGISELHRLAAWTAVPPCPSLEAPEPFGFPFSPFRLFPFLPFLIPAHFEVFSSLCDIFIQNVLLIQ